MGVFFLPAYIFGLVNFLVVSRKWFGPPEISRRRRSRVGVHRGCARTIARAIMKLAGLAFLLSGLGVVACNQRGSGTGTSPSVER
jgi:hypothetical protein